MQKYLRQATLIIVREFTFFLYAHVVFEKRHFYFHVGELYPRTRQPGFGESSRDWNRGGGRIVSVAPPRAGFDSFRYGQLVIRVLPFASRRPPRPSRGSRIPPPPTLEKSDEKSAGSRAPGAATLAHCDARRSLARVRTNARRVRRRGASPRGFARAHPRPDAPRTRSRRALDANPARFRRRKVRGIEKRLLGKCWRASRAGPGSTGAGRSATGPGPGRRGTRATWRTLPRVRPRRGARVNDPPRRSPFRSSAFRFRVHVLSR